ncbi:MULTISPECIES: class I SAM-dependent methyltransferase [Corynebacterium]|uniref:SAM-dependent methyltransferase n=1 Tax=Corynebacterium flavescens TaxID=28028 RepID=A0A1L7CLK9_CORFL|nr:MULTISPECIES: class I SAM-dependent methyltransferase [Corynebacterium]APT86736.1 SAM-dependent methyltransferase [Corynebacterium flavescens]KAA8722536.1 class I SAM-dependent methyltransferase [Corynebacterium flavescens]MDN6100524.1 class I SAM-dependent methyltransferase [Corynebacterium flavescens]MDN6200178.1 class I SAM-dependent methyltransferase [Corynebacterium flavescens]MDN6226551.1 class I SAM-dependent methyltransferase [Corynebacterium flavescens]
MPTPSQANERFWDADSASYHLSHPDYLADFYWCPEMLHEKDAHLLGDTTGKRILEVGCGSAACTRWLHGRSALALGFDISRSMLGHAATRKQSPDLPLVQADVLNIPLASNSFDIAFSAFGALPFVQDIDHALAEISRVTRPGGRFVFSVNHPMRWIFPDDPGELTASVSYFERSYLEHDDAGELTYAEFHRTLGDWFRALQMRGSFLIEDVIEPEWPPELSTEWGQWSPLRGGIFPGTIIFSCTNMK